MGKISKGEKSWILYDWANSAYSMTITSTILPIYFKMVAEQGGMNSSTSTALWGYTISITTFIVAMIAPILGNIADYKGNKKRLFNLFFILGLVSTIFLIFVPEDAPVFLLIVYTLSTIGFCGANVFYDAFLVDVTTEDRMDYVSSMGYGMGYIGSTIPFIICIIVVLLSQNGIIQISVPLACKIIFLITALWWGGFTIPLLKNVNQKYYVKKQSQIIKNSFKDLLNTLRKIKKDKAILLFLSAYFFYIDGVHTIIGMATSYGTDLGISMTALLIILLLTQFVAFPFTIIYGKLSEKYGGNKLILVGIVTYALICCYGYFIKTAVGFWILAMLVGSAQGGIQAISRSYFAKLVPKEKSAEYFGFYSIFGKFAAVLGPFLVGVVTQITGKTNNGIISLIILFIIGGLIMIRVPDLDKKIVVEENKTM